MVKLTPTQITLFMLPAALTTIVAFLSALAWDLQTQLEDSRTENAQLRESLPTQMACAPVQVTCVCPEYEEGWDDAEFAEGCDPAEIELEQIELICAELDEYGYVPRC